ncbi:MAG TPA: hypothetical protein VME17_16975 [Bryobacteraceae bacterium]|nr:hypothetical protein [Bryobacteraceae bacterium]
MTTRTTAIRPTAIRPRIYSSIVCAALAGVTLLAQSNSPQAQPGPAEISGVPSARGVYYHAASGWVSLPYTLLMPFAEGKNAALEVLNVGSEHTVAQIPGPHANVQIGNDTRPIFYLHGISPSDLYLVRDIRKTDYRELRMPISIHFRRWAHFRNQDIAELEVQPLGDDVVRVRPRADLRPGEYTLASVVQPGGYWVRLGFDFGLVGGAGR